MKFKSFFISVLLCISLFISPANVSEQFLPTILLSDYDLELNLGEEYSIFSILLPLDNAPQISARCAIDFEGCAATVPLAFDFCIVTIISFFRFLLKCLLLLDTHRIQDL